MPVTKTDHATKTAALAMSAARAAAKSAEAAASISMVHGELLARLDERQKASGEKFDTFIEDWRVNSGALHSELREIKSIVLNHEHPALATKIEDGCADRANITKRVNDISGDLRKGNIGAGLGIAFASILAAVATYFDFRR